MEDMYLIKDCSNRDVIEEIVDNLTLFDDNLMSRVFDNNIEATELFLDIVLERKVQVISVVGQKEIKNHEIGKRTITLDIHAIDVDGQEIDIEVQGDSKGAHIRRARFHSGVIDSRMLNEGQSFRELKDSYIIFMYKSDKFGCGLPIYHIDRYVRETKELFGDGSHIIYVNGKYNGNDSLGKLISDFHQNDSDKMYYKELSESVKHFKKTEEGRDNMCEAVEAYGDKRAEIAAENEKINSVRSLMENMKWTVEQALNALGIQGDERTMIIGQFQK